MIRWKTDTLQIYAILAIYKFKKRQNILRYKPWNDVDDGDVAGPFNFWR